MFRFLVSSHRPTFPLLAVVGSVAFLTKGGYTTEFISGMDVAWENCAEALKYQHFTKVTGKFTLKEQHPEYEYNSIGVFDHYLFRSIQERLDQHTAKPQMLLCMTTTNHPAV